jgi:tetratricopeptide (TPR) repeat protein
MDRHPLRCAGNVALVALIAAVALAFASAPPARSASAPPPQTPTLGSPAAPPALLSTLTGPATHLPLGAMQLAPRASQRANSGPPGDFPFQTVQSADGLIALHWYGWYPSFGSDFLGTVQRALRERVQPRLGYGLRSRVDIYGYNSRADFLAGAQPESPDITGAYSIFAPSQVFMPLYYGAADTFDLLSHEMTHITFHQSLDIGHLGDDFRMFPLWFDEGLAVSDESDTSPGYGVYRTQLVQSVRNGGPYIDVFKQFQWSYPQDPNTDDLAYAEAGAFIQYLPATFGADRFHQFIVDARNGDLNTAAMMDLGADLQALESQWEVSLGKPAIQHAAGVVPARSTPTPYTPHHEPTIEGRTTPYGVGGGDDVLATVLTEAGAGTGAALLGLGAGVLWQRRKRRSWLARQYAPPLVSAPYAMDAPPSLASPAADWSTPPHGAPWPQLVALALAAPFALGIGMLWLLLEPTRLWRHAVLAGAVTALLLAITAGALAWRTWRGGRVYLAHAVSGAALLALAVLVVTQTAGQAGMAQGLGYEHDSAYALAVEAYGDAGAPSALLARVHTEWADEAYHNSSDYPVATAQYRAAIALEGNDKAAKDNRATLLTLTAEWGKRLNDAHEFKQAAAVFAAQLASPSCDNPCRTTMREKGGAVYLAWAADLIAQKQPDAALAQLRAVTRTFPQSQAAASAQRVLAGESQGLAGVWAAEKAGDGAAMDLLLALVAVRTTDPLQLAQCAEAPQMVSGTLASIRLYKTPIHLFFLGFRTESDARFYMDHIDTQDVRALRQNAVAAQTDKNGAFVAWLPAGYVYIPAWEAPPEGGHDDYFSWRSTFITVRPYTPVPPVALS